MGGPTFSEVKGARVDGVMKRGGLGQGTWRKEGREGKL